MERCSTGASTSVGETAEAADGFMAESVANASRGSRAFMRRIWSEAEGARIITKDEHETRFQNVNPANSKRKLTASRRLSATVELMRLVGSPICLVKAR